MAVDAQARGASLRRGVRSGTAELRTIAFSILVFLLLAVELEVEGPGGFWWERHLTHFLIGHWGDGPVSEARRLSHYLAGTEGLVAAAALAFAVCAVRGSWRAALTLGASPAAVLLTPLLKDAFTRPPPAGELVHMYSFPSGHGTGTMAIAAALATVLWRTQWRWPALAGGAFVVLAVGAAVVADRGHWPSDVFAGWALGLGWVALVRIAISAAGRRHRLRSGPKPPSTAFVRIGIRAAPPGSRDEQPPPAGGAARASRRSACAQGATAQRGPSADAEPRSPSGADGSSAAGSG